MPRPQVKDLFERIGRPQIKPQASTDTFGYAQPANRSQSNDLTQLGGLMQKFSEAADSWADVLIEKEQKEGSEEGRAMALAAKRKGIQHLINQSKKLPHGLNKYAVKAYHYNTGKLVAEAPSTAALLNEGVSEWISETIKNEDLDAFQMREKLNKEVIEPRLQGLIDQLPDTAMARDLGFSEGIQPVLGKLNEAWLNDFERQVYTKNEEAFSDTLFQHFDIGNYEGASQLFYNKEQDPSDPNWSYSRAFNKGLDPNLDRRKFLFFNFKAHLENNVLKPSKLGSPAVSSIVDAIDRVESIMSVKEAGSNALIGNYQVNGTMPYKDLKRDLRTQLAKVIEDAEKRDEDNRTANFEMLQNSFEINQDLLIDNLKTTVSIEDVVPAGDLDAIAGLPPDKQWVRVLNEKQVTVGTLFNASPIAMVETYKKLLDAGEIKDLNGNVMTRKDFPFEIEETFAQTDFIENIKKVVETVNKRVSNLKANRYEEKAAIENQLAQEQADVQELIINFLRRPTSPNAESWDTEEFLQAWEQLSPVLLREQQKLYGVLVEPTKLQKEMLDNLKSIYADSYLSNTTNADSSFYNIASQAIRDGKIDIFRMPFSKVEQFIRSNPEFNTVSQTTKNNFLSDLKNKRKNAFNYSNYKAKEGATLLKQIRSTIYSRNSKFAADLEAGGTLTAADTRDMIIFGHTILESKFIEHQNIILNQINFSEKIREVFRHFEDDELALDFLNKMSYSTSDKPIMLPAIGDKPEVKLLDSSPTHLMEDSLKRTPIPDKKTGETFKDWDDWMRWVKRSQALAREATK